jgi:hypothetical protein
MQEMDQIVGTHETVQGKKPESADSGVALEILRQQGLAVLEPIFDNFRRLRMACAKFEIELIQKFFTPEKVLRILGSVASRLKDVKLLELWQTMNGQGDLQPAEAERLKATVINQLMKIEYDVVIDEAPATATARQMNSMILDRLMQRGLPIDPTVMVDLTDLGDDMKERLKQFMMAAGKTPLNPPAKTQTPKGRP